MNSVVWKVMRDEIKHYLQRAVDGKKVLFRHSMFYGYEFEIKAKRADKKD